MTWRGEKLPWLGPANERPRIRPSRRLHSVGSRGMGEDRMISNAVLIYALWFGAVALILYWCWIKAREDEGTGYKGEDDG